MEYQVKEKSSIEKEITLKIKKDLVEELISKKIKNIKNTVSISGFRKGKVPIHMIRRRYEISIKDEIISNLLDKEIKSILIKEKLKPVNTPKVSSSLSEKNYLFSVLFEVFPQIKLKNLVFKLEKPSVQLKDVDIDNIIDNLRIELSEWKAKESPSVINNKIKIKFNIYKDIDQRKKDKYEETSIIVKTNNIISHLDKTFKAKLNGLEKNKTIILEEEDHKSKEKTKIEIVVLDIYETNQIESNKKISKAIKCPSYEIDNIKKQIKINTDRHINKIANNHLKDQCLRKIYEENKFDVPNSLLSHKDMNKENSIDKDSIKQRIITELLVKEIIKKENIKIKKLEIQKKLDYMYSMRPELKSNKVEESLVNNIKNELLVENVISFILEKCEIKVIKVNLEEFLSRYKI